MPGAMADGTTADVSLREARSVLRACRLCPRCCGADRLSGQKGFCGAGDAPRVFRRGPHHGEEPPLSGTRGSGTVFFSRCTLACLYCQNFPWSQEGRGADWPPGRLAETLRELRRAGCHNWNMVSPTPWLPWIVEALEAAKRDGPGLPVVYNTSGFERPQVLRALAGTVDVYLTDLRYARAASAAEGSGFGGYAETAREALRVMWAQAGPLRTDADGIATGGTICRLLVLPNRADEAVANLEWIAATVGTELAVSVMAQYVPAHRAAATPSWERPVTREEYGRVCDAAERLGFDNGWIQDFGRRTPDELVGYRMREDT